MCSTWRRLGSTKYSLPPPAARLVAQQGDVVLAEHAAREVADQDADLRAEHQPRGAAGSAGGGPNRWRARGFGVEVLDRLQQVAEVDHVGADPARAIEDLDWVFTSDRSLPGVGGDGPFDLAEQLSRTGPAAAPARPGAASACGRPREWPLGGPVPVDHARAVGDRPVSAGRRVARTCGVVAGRRAGAWSRALPRTAAPPPPRGSDRVRMRDPYPGIGVADSSPWTPGRGPCLDTHALVGRQPRFRLRPRLITAYDGPARCSSLPRDRSAARPTAPRSPPSRSAERFEGRVFTLHELEQRGVRIAGARRLVPLRGQDWQLKLEPAVSRIISQSQGL